MNDGNVCIRDNVHGGHLRNYLRNSSLVSNAVTILK